MLKYYKNSISPKEYTTIFYIQQLFQTALSNSAIPASIESDFWWVIYIYF